MVEGKVDYTEMIVTVTAWYIVAMILINYVWRYALYLQDASDLSGGWGWQLPFASL